MVTFQRKHEAACVILLSDNQVNCDTTDYDSFPIIVSYPPVSLLTLTELPLSFFLSLWTIFREVHHNWK